MCSVFSFILRHVNFLSLHVCLAQSGKAWKAILSSHFFLSFFLVNKTHFRIKVRRERLKTFRFVHTGSSRRTSSASSSSFECNFIDFSLALHNRKTSRSFIRKVQHTQKKSFLFASAHSSLNQVKHKNCLPFATNKNEWICLCVMSEYCLLFTFSSIYFFSFFREIKRDWKIEKLLCSSSCYWQHVFIRLFFVLSELE